MVNFDRVYDTFHEPLAKALNYKAIRCDKLDSGGSIHLEMFQHIYDCALVLVDLTSCNPNVMYELGVRHTLARGTTVMLKQTGTDIPFNISGYPILDYEPNDPSSLATIKKKVAKRLAEIHKQPHKSDSPVLDRLNVAIIDDSPQILLSGQTVRIEFQLHEHEYDRIGVIKGELENVKGVDVWVNSENTHMEMARPIEKSISSFIRYHGAKRDKSGRITDDSIYRELSVQKNKARAPFPPATVFVTDSGQLKKSHKVEKVVHVAAVHGSPVSVFKPVDQLAACITKTLEIAGTLKTGKKACRSILFPLFGTGHGRGSLESTVPILMNAAISFLKTFSDSPLDTIYFLAQTERQAEVCTNYLKLNKDLIGPI